MTLEEVKGELKAFDRFNFEEKPHIYWWLDADGNQVQAKRSMTQIIGKFENPFPRDEIAPFSAKKLNMTVKEVLDLWEFENELSKVKGTHIHKYMEHKWLGLEPYKYPPEEVIAKFGYDVLEHRWGKLTRLADKFYEDYKDKIIPVGIELILGDEDYDMGGAIDFLGLVIEAFSIYQVGDLAILDWKSNKEIKTKNQYKKYMLKFLTHLDDINFIHYCLQLNGYQHLIEKNTKLQINNRHTIVWMNEKNDDYVIYTTKDLKKEAIAMIQEGISLEEIYGY